jgi:hypothetical protein
MAKKSAVKKERIIRALKNWSPKGLCAGTLVQKNGDPKKTEACAIGCLSLDFVTSAAGKKWCRSQRRSMKSFIGSVLYEKSTLNEMDDEDSAFLGAMRKYYGIDGALEFAMMSFNDGCVDRKGRPNAEHKVVPASIRRTIYSLRKKFTKFAKAHLRETGHEYPGA